MKFPFYILDVFTNEPFGGNQLGMLPDARGISDAGMQKIAREFNFAETSFVFPPETETGTAKVRIFTPFNELDFAGHPSVGTACGLVYGKHVETHDLILEENVGPIPVRIEKKGAVLEGTLTNSTPLIIPDFLPDKSVVARALNLAPSDIKQVFYASVGLEFCFAQLNDSATVDRAKSNLSALSDGGKDVWTTNLYFFAGDLEKDAKIYARMFASDMGIEEDPATGSAVAALVGFAAQKSGLTNGRFDLEVEQGTKMQRQSHMNAFAMMDKGDLVSVSVGGGATLTATGEIEVPDRWLA